MVFLCKVLFLLTVHQFSIEGVIGQSKELVGFQSVSERLLTGSPVYYYVNLDGCKQYTVGSRTRYTSSACGGKIDLFTLINDKTISDYPFFETSTFKYTRNETDGLISVLKQLTVSSTNEANITIAVTTVQGGNIVLERHTYGCLMGEKSDIHFYADEATPNELESYDEIQSALILGGRVRFVAEYHICRGGYEFSVGGSDFGDFDVRMEGNYKTLSSTSERMFTDDTGYYRNILTTKLYDSRQVLFTESLNNMADMSTSKETNFTCFLQGHQPGGSVRFYQL